MRQLALKSLMMLVLAAPIGACAHKGAVSDGVPLKINNVMKTRVKPGDATIGVNAFLWRATLDTLNFMPTLSADPFGGTYITDWHATPEKPDERFKIQVYILDTRLRADGIAVQVFRQTKSGSDWVDASVDPDTTLQVENAILTRARQLRIATLDSKK